MSEPEEHDSIRFAVSEMEFETCQHNVDTGTDNTATQSEAKHGPMAHLILGFAITIFGCIFVPVFVALIHAYNIIVYIGVNQLIQPPQSCLQLYQALQRLNSVPVELPVPISEYIVLRSMITFNIVLSALVQPIGLFRYCTERATSAELIAYTRFSLFLTVLSFLELCFGWKDTTFFTHLLINFAAAFAVYLRFRSKENPWQGYPAISVSHWRSRVNIWADFKERSVGSKRGTAVAEGYDVDEGKVFLFNQANGQERHEGQKEKPLL